MNFKNALVSVSDKSGIIEFLKPMVDNGLRIVSTGGTAQHLIANGIKVIPVSEQTGFPEVMDGRVRTLHPRIHMALLSRSNNKEDQNLLKEHGIEEFDLVIVNLYPYEKGISDGKPTEDMTELVDIGGPSLLRAAAKNYSRLTVICDPEDYSWIQNEPNITEEQRKKLAIQVFFHTSTYDSMIANHWAGGLQDRQTSLKEYSIGGKQFQTLRYGENPQQFAKWYKFAGSSHGLQNATILQGKALSYNNILDIETATSMTRLISDPCSVGVKHCNPCGVAVRKNTTDALKTMLLADPMSIFGGIVASNQEIDRESANILCEIFLECIVAPKFSEEALDIFKKKKNLRILEWPELQLSCSDFDMKTLSGGFLVQNRDTVSKSCKEWDFLGDTPSEKIQQDLLLAWKVCSQLKSNAIALVKNQRTVGLGMGQVNRVDAVRQALDRAEKHHPEETNLVMASDAFFPFPDSIELAAQRKVKWVAQPGGSIKDETVIQKAKDLGVHMVLTGKRHFKH